MICQKKIQKTGSRCRDKAIAMNEIGTHLCAYHYDYWIAKLHMRNRSYYKGLVRPTSEIVHFIYLDCVTRKMDIERIIDVMLRHTHLSKDEIIECLADFYNNGQEEFLAKYPDWKTMLKKHVRV